MRTGTYQVKVFWEGDYTLLTSNYGIHPVVKKKMIDDFLFDIRPSSDEIIEKLVEKHQSIFKNGDYSNVKITSMIITSIEVVDTTIHLI